MQQEEDYFFKRFFLPFTVKKAVAWIVVIGIVVYANMLINGFAWDDVSYIVYNQEVHFLNFFKVFQPSYFNHGNQYRALSALYFTLIYSLFAENPFFYHLIQLVMHLANSILVFFLLKKFFKKNISYVLTLLFLVHPIQVESVSFIGASVSPLFSLFGTLAVLIALSNRLLRKYWAYPAMSFLLLLSVLTKETGAVFAFVVIVAVFLFERRHILFSSLSVILTAIIYLYLRIVVANVHLHGYDPRAINPIIHMNFWERVLNIPAIVFYYLKTLIYPAALSIDQVWVVRDIKFSNFYLPLFFDLLFAGFILGLGFWVFKNNKKLFPAYLFFLAWFGGALFIHLQFVPLDMTVADRWMYLVIVGLIGLIGVFISLLPKKVISSKINLTLVVTVLVLLSVRSIVRNADWKDDITLLTHDTKVSDNYELENNLGSFLSYARDFKGSVVHTKRSVELFPYDKNLTNLGFAYEQVNDLSNAIKSYENAIALYNLPTRNDTTIERAYLRLSGIYLFNGQQKKAVKVLLEATARYPNDGVLWSFLAAGFYQIGRQGEALNAATKAKKLLPGKSTTSLYQLILEKKQFDVRTL